MRDRGLVSLRRLCAQEYSYAVTTSTPVNEPFKDKRGNVKRRYNEPDDDAPSPSAPSPPTIKTEPEDFEDDSATANISSGESSDSEYTQGASISRPRRQNATQKIRVNIVRITGNSSGSRRNDTKFEPSSATAVKHKRRRGRRRAKARKYSDQSGSESEEKGIDVSAQNAYPEDVDFSNCDRLSSHPSNINVETAIRKRRSVTLMQKMDVIRMADSGTTQNEIARKLKIGRSTISQIILMREKIEAACRSGGLSRKRILRRNGPNTVRDVNSGSEPNEKGIGADVPAQNVSQEDADFSQVETDCDRLSSNPTDINVKTSIQKRRSVTLMQKMDVIRMADSGTTQHEIARKLKIGRSTVSQIILMREKIEAACRSGGSLRKRVRRDAFQDVNQALYKWYEKVKTQNLFVNAKVLLTMAENVANELGRTDFTPSPNWLTRFKERYNIRFSNTLVRNMSNSTGKSKKEPTEISAGNTNTDCDYLKRPENVRLTCDDKVACLKDDWLKNTWRECLVKNSNPMELYSEKDVYFVEEIGVLYRITPKQAWQFKYGKGSFHNFSITEERLTVLICSNADGSEKKKLVIAGQRIEIPNNLPVDYIVTTEPSNWLTKSAFLRWINCWNRNLELLGKKILVLTSSSPIHMFESSFSNLKIVNIPTRVLSALHPVHQGIAKNFKMRYRRLLLEKLISYEGSRPVSCLEAVFMLSTAWNELSPNLIRKAFLDSGYFKCTDVPNIPDEFDCSALMTRAVELDLAVPLSKYSFAEYAEIDNTLCAIECSKTVANLEDDFSTDNVVGNDLLGQDSYLPVQCALSAADAHAALHNMRLYAMSRVSCPQEVHNALSTLESFLLGHSQ